jgi:hypothetical protein
MAPELILVRCVGVVAIRSRCAMSKNCSPSGLAADHTTIWRWEQRYGPELEQRLRRHLNPTNKPWRVDEMYIRVTGRWCYLYWSWIPAIHRIRNPVSSIQLLDWRPEPRRPVSLGSSSVTVLQTLALEAPGSRPNGQREIPPSEFPVKVGRESSHLSGFLRESRC